jgi:hypothetical protein
MWVRLCGYHKGVDKETVRHLSVKVRLGACGFVYVVITMVWTRILVQPIDVTRTQYTKCHLCSAL